MQRFLHALVPVWEGDSFTHILFHKIVGITASKSPVEAVDVINGLFEKIEQFLGSHSLTIKFQKIYASYGGIMKAKRVAVKGNFDEIQVKYFSNKF